MSVAIVVAGGEPSGSPSPARLPPTDIVVAADSGLDRARDLGLVPTVLVGDLDSVSAGGLAWAEAVGVTIERHPVDKDATDLELAMRRAAALADELVVVDGGAGRLDHAFGNLQLLAAEQFADRRVSALVGTAIVTVVRGVRQLTGNPGSLVSLFAVGGAACGVTTGGLKWPLHEATLSPGDSLGVSNEFLGHAASVAVEHGAILAVQPG